MKKAIFAITVIVMMLMTSCAQYVQEPVYWLVIKNDTEHSLRFRLNEDDKFTPVYKNYYTMIELEEGDSYDIDLFFDFGEVTFYEGGYYYTKRKMSDMVTEHVDITHNRNLVHVTYDGSVHTTQEKIND